MLSLSQKVWLGWQQAGAARSGGSGEWHSQRGRREGGQLVARVSCYAGPNELPRFVSIIFSYCMLLPHPYTLPPLLPLPLQLPLAVHWFAALFSCSPPPFVRISVCVCLCCALFCALSMSRLMAACYYLFLFVWRPWQLLFVRSVHPVPPPCKPRSLLLLVVSAFSCECLKQHH